MTAEKTTTTSDVVRKRMYCAPPVRWNGATTLNVPGPLDLHIRRWLIEGGYNGQPPPLNQLHAVSSKRVETGIQRDSGYESALVENPNISLGAVNEQLDHSIPCFKEPVLRLSIDVTAIADLRGLVMLDHGREMQLKRPYVAREPGQTHSGIGADLMELRNPFIYEWNLYCIRLPKQEGPSRCVRNEAGFVHKFRCHEHVHDPNGLSCSRYLGRQITQNDTLFSLLLSSGLTVFSLAFGRCLAMCSTRERIGLPSQPKYCYCGRGSYEYVDDAHAERQVSNDDRPCVPPDDATVGAQIPARADTVNQAHPLIPYWNISHSATGAADGRAHTSLANVTPPRDLRTRVIAVAELQDLTNE